MSIVCHKCDYRFDTSVFQDVDIPLVDIKEKNPVKEALTLTKDLHAMLLSTKQELPFVLGNKTFNISAYNNLLYKVNECVYPRNSRIVVFEDGDAQIIEDEEFNKEYKEL
jgi:protein associated with RNAse G/E